jgi:hypothetical protein
MTTTSNFISTLSPLAPPISSLLVDAGRGDIFPPYSFAKLLFKFLHTPAGFQ